MFHIWYFWIGLIASAGISVFTIPQLINLIKTRNTAFINIPMYAIYLVGCFAFLLGGILMACDTSNPNRLASGLPLIIAQSICGCVSSIIFCWKIKNYRRAKKAMMTELDYCKKVKDIYDGYQQQVKSLSQSQGNKSNQHANGSHMNKTKKLNKTQEIQEVK